VEAAGQACIVLTAAAVDNNTMCLYVDRRTALQVFPSDVDVPAEGVHVTLMLADGHTMQVRLLVQLHRLKPQHALHPACPHPQSLHLGRTLSL